MRFYYDQEFLEDGETIMPISIGIVADDDQGRELYLINRDADLDRIAEHEWLMANVVPHLPLVQTNTFGPTRLEWDLGAKNGARVVSRRVMAELVEGFISQYGMHRRQHELWGWYADYDHVALCQLWGRMIDLPASVPMFTHDLRQLVGRHHVSVPKQGTSEHHALADARWNREVHRWWGVRHAPGMREPIRLDDPEHHAELDRLLKLQRLPGMWTDLSSETRAEIRRQTRGTPFWRLLDEAAGIPT